MSHDHSHHGHNHGDMDMGHDMPPMCSMNMLFTWSFENLCIVFPSWRVTGPISLVLSLIGVAALTAAYEAIREYTRRYEEREQKRIAALPHDGLSATSTLVQNSAEGNEGSSLLGLNTGGSAEAEESKGRLVKGILYGVQVFYSFFIMLLFMTYNGWIMIAVGVGATLGYLTFGAGSVTKSAACH